MYFLPELNLLYRFFLFFDPIYDLRDFLKNLEQESLENALKLSYSVMLTHERQAQPLESIIAVLTSKEKIPTIQMP